MERLGRAAGGLKVLKCAPMLWGRATAWCKSSARPELEGEVERRKHAKPAGLVLVSGV